MTVLLDLPNQLLEVIIEYAVGAARVDVDNQQHELSNGSAMTGLLINDSIQALRKTPATLRLVHPRFAICAARFVFTGWYTLNIKSSFFAQGKDELWERITCTPMRKHTRHLVIDHRSAYPVNHFSGLPKSEILKADRGARDAEEKSLMRGDLRTNRQLDAFGPRKTSATSPWTLTHLCEKPIRTCKRFSQAVISGLSMLLGFGSRTPDPPVPFAALRSIDVRKRPAALLLPYLLRHAPYVTSVVINLAEDDKFGHWDDEADSVEPEEPHDGAQPGAHQLRSVTIYGFGSAWSINLLESWQPRTEVLRLATSGADIHIDYSYAVKVIKRVGGWSGFKRLEWRLDCTISREGDAQGYEANPYGKEVPNAWEQAITKLGKEWRGRELKIVEIVVRGRRP